MVGLVSLDPAYNLLCQSYPLLLPPPAVLGFTGEPPETVLIQYALGRIISVIVSVLLGLLLSVIVFPGRCVLSVNCVKAV